MKLSNAGTFRAFAAADRMMSEHVMPKLPTGVRSPFVFRSDRVGTIVAARPGSRLVRPEAVRCA